MWKNNLWMQFEFYVLLPNCRFDFTMNQICAACIENVQMQQSISADLFQQVKPYCVQIVQLTNHEDLENVNGDLIVATSQLNRILQSHKVKSVGGYSITTNLSDYIFFPLSKLLGKQSNHLDVKVLANIFDIISFLIRNSWIPNGTFSSTLILQLLPLILYLIKTANSTSELSQSFTSLIYIMLPGMTHTFNTQDLKVLTMLGDLIGVLLEHLKQNGHNKDLNVISDNLECIEMLMGYMTSQQVSRIFPGVILTLINFCTTNSIHFTVLCKVIDMVLGLLRIVFNDKELGIVEEDMKVDWKEIKDIENVLRTNNIKLNSDDFRNSSWLQANVKQLKVLLTTFIPKVYERKGHKPQVNRSMMRLIKISLNDCFLCLFDILGLWIDTICLGFYNDVYRDTGRVDDSEEKFILTELGVYFNESLRVYNSKIYELLFDKTEDMVTKMGQIMSSSQEERILKYILSLKVHFNLLRATSESEDMNKLICLVLVNLRDSLMDLKPIQVNKPWLLNDQNAISENNKLDNVELPPYVNANNLTKFHKGPKTLAQAMVNRWELVWDNNTMPVRFFEEVVSNVEMEIETFLRFLSTFKFDKLLVIQQLFEDYQSTATQGVSIWISKLFLEKSSPDLDFDEYIDLSTAETDNIDLQDYKSELIYFVINETQEIIDSLEPELESLTTLQVNKGQQITNKSLLQAYNIALTTMGELSGILPKSEFKTTILINYIFTLFESLTYSSLHNNGKLALLMIVNNYYKGSVQDLIMDNLNYLIDGLSLKLAMPNSLGPSLLGILLIILKVAGNKLIEGDQLGDIISQVFILIDNYHGYSVLVEGFFRVFREIVHQVKQKYLNNLSLLEVEQANAENVSPYKPWGMTTIAQLNDLLDTTKKLVEPFEDYSSEQEYFKAPGVPFTSEEKDSDDEEDEQDEETPQTEQWPSCIPKQPYFQVQKMFIYGLRLLSHPSDTLKYEILVTLVDIYPLLSTNYLLLLPIVSANLPELVSLLDNESVAAINFLIKMIETDRLQNEMFFGRKFIDIFNRIEPLDKKPKDMKFSSLLLEFLIIGLNTYERVVPDVISVKIMKTVMLLGKPQVPLGRQARNIEWVLRRSITKKKVLMA